MNEKNRQVLARDKQEARATGAYRSRYPLQTKEDVMTDNTRKIALVTGGSRGLGAATALALGARGVSTIITYRADKEAADRTVAQIVEKGGQAAALALDTGVVSSFPAFVNELQAVLQANFGRDRIDYLVNNAGHGLNKPFADVTEDEFDRLMQVHFKGVFFLTQALLPVIADGGRIVNLSSGLARFALPGFSAYASMKGAIEVLTRYLAKELGARGIAVNTVAPGAIETDFGGGAVRDNKPLNDMVRSVTALGRAGVPDDIGPMIASLLSEDNRWINGQRIEVSGGMFV
jgi:NAD(P)-dependent dehydrogenase (short-subunit alcohol dehydrogenase family)